MSTHIVLIDDHRALTDAMSMIINQQEDMNVVGIANNFSDGEKLIQLSEVDLAVIDMNLGKEDSCDLIQLSRVNGQIPIVLSAYSDLSIVKRALRSGAQGYISKTSAASSLINGIRSVLKGEIYFDQIIMQEMSNYLTQAKIDTSIPERVMINQLTDRERDIIRLIALEYTSEEIAGELFLAKNTVDTYRKNLISKLHVKNAVGLGIFALKNGLI